MKISELMQDIRDLDLVLPEFQREYVWTLDQAKVLIDSLLKDYPTGSLLVWKTSTPLEIKNSAFAPDKMGNTSVILDGQQRLTTLYLLTQNDVPPYYRDDEISNDPRKLYFNLASRVLQYYQAQRMDKDPSWVPVTACFAQPCPVKAVKIAKAKETELSDDGMDELSDRADSYQDNLTLLQNILVHDYPIQVVPASAGIGDAIDVFDRVNKQGTKLSEAELALAHATAKWPKIRPHMKDKLDELRSKRFALDLTFMVRALTAVVRQRALYETLHDASEAELKEGWSRLSHVLDHLTTILPTWAYVHSTDDIGSTNVLIAPIAYLAQSGGKFKSEAEIRQFVRWLYAASTWARYSSQTDQKLEFDVSIVAQTPSPWSRLLDAIIDQRGRIEMKATDLEGRGVQHPFYRMAFVLAKINGAIDWYTGEPLVASHSTPWHNHHIFPQAVLYGAAGYSSESHVDAQKVNEIANRAFLSANSNQKIQATPPEAALALVEERFPGALQKQFVPLNPDSWKLEHYDAFLAKRRELIADAYNARMEALAGPIDVPTKPTVADLIAAPESGSLEFKSSLRWDVNKQQVNKELQKVIAKSVAGFLNAEGGTLLIGVADDGTVLGIESDIATLGKGNRDGFELALKQTLTNFLGAEFSPFYATSFESLGEHSVCRVEIDRSPKPVYVHDGTASDFYIRGGNATVPLGMQAAVEYIGMRWE
jgi:hypothetical protein